MYIARSTVKTIMWKISAAIYYEFMDQVCETKNSNFEYLWNVAKNLKEINKIKEIFYCFFVCFLF